MCEHGDTVPLAVPVLAHLSAEGRDVIKVKPVDRCIAPIVKALNDACVTTVSSCCGHGGEPGAIELADGRTLHIARRDDIAATHPLSVGSDR